jgi:DNA repair protein RecO (recombination protein O)
LATVTEWKQTESLGGLRERLARLRAAEYAAEVVAGLTEDWDPHPTVFDGLVGLLRELCEASDTVTPLVRFQRGLLTDVGSWPEFRACLSCGRVDGGQAVAYFSSHEGGLLCRDCEAAFVEKLEVAPDTLRGLIGQPDAVSAPSAFGVLNYHISHLMGRAPLTGELVIPSRGHRATGVPPSRRGRSGPSGRKEPS